MAGLGTSIRIANAYVQLDVRGRRRMESLLGRAAVAVGKSAQQMRRLGLGATAVGVAGAYAFGRMVTGASDLVEQTNKAIEVFGGSVNKILDWSKTTAASFGIAKREALAYSSELGLIIQQSGATKKESVALSQSMVELAADLASFNNVEISVAFAKLKSGLVGESKPLREFGILLNESEVGAKALALGFEKVNGELTEAAKVSARYELILEQSLAAQGDFGRTINDLANSTRVLKARLKDVSDEIGTVLIPTFTYLVDRAIKLIAVFEEMIGVNPRIVKTLFGVTLAVTAVGVALTTAGVAAGLFSYSLTNLNKILAFTTFAHNVLTGAIVGTTAAVVALQAAFLALAFFIGYQVGAAIADIFFDSTEAAKKLNEELLRTQALAKGLDELRLQNMRTLVFESGNLIKAEEKLRREYSKTKNEIADMRVDLKQYLIDLEIKRSGTTAERAVRSNTLEGYFKRKKELEKLEKVNEMREQVLSEAQTKIQADKQKKAEDAANATEKENTRYVDQLKLLERQRIELEKGAIAAEAFDDAQAKLTPDEKKDLDTKRKALEADRTSAQLAKEKAAKAESIKKSGREQLASLGIQLRFQRQGSLEVEKQLNIMKGMSPILAEQIRARKEKIQLDQEAIDLAEEQKNKQAQLLDNYKASRRELELQLLGLQKGEEAAARARDKDAEFSLKQRKELARLRKEIKKEEREDEKERERTRELKKRQKDGDDTLGALGTYFGGGFAQRLATGMTPEQAAANAKEQRKEQIKYLRQVATAYRNFNAGFGKFQKNQDTWHAFQKKVFGRIVTF